MVRESAARLMHRINSGLCLVFLQRAGYLRGQGTYIRRIWVGGVGEGGGGRSCCDAKP